MLQLRRVTLLALLVATGCGDVAIVETPDDDDDDDDAVENEAPSAPVVLIQPVDPSPDVPLECVVVTESIDPDGDPVTYRWSWLRDNQPTDQLAEVVAASETSAGEVWTCIVTPTDGTEEGLDARDAVTIIQPCVYGLEAACPGLDCADILAASPGSADGEYWVTGSGVEAFEVDCDMTTDLGGWIRLSLSHSDGVLTNSDGASNPWSKCADSATAHFEWLTDETAVELDHLAPLVPTDVLLEYANPASRAVFTTAQAEALRGVVSELHPATRMVAVTADDDGNSLQDGDASGHEVYVEGGGEWRLLTPGTGGECGYSTGWPLAGSESSFYMWSTSAETSGVDGDTGLLDSDLGALDPSAVLPTRARLNVFTGGGVAFGWETEVFLVR